MMLNNSNMIELNQQDLMNIDGGNPYYIGIFVGVLATYVYSVADTAVERATGDSIAGHTVTLLSSSEKLGGLGIDY